MAERIFPRLLYGHRGASGLLPENTMQAFRQALQDGANALMLDIRASSDGVIVVIHDKDGRRTANIYESVEHTPWSRLKNWDVGEGFRREHGISHFADQAFRIPMLSEVLEAFPGIPLIVDIKSNNLDTMQKVMQVVKQHDAADRVTLTSLYTRITRALQVFGYEGSIGWSFLEVIELKFLPLVLDRSERRGKSVQAPVSQLSVQVATRRFIDKCHKLGIRVDFFHVDNIGLAQELYEMGADGVMSDNPAVVLPAFIRANT